MEKLRQAKIRINATEREILDAIERASKTYPDLTTQEIGSAMLRLLESINNQEIKRQCE